MAEIKLIALDLDGTLLDSQKRLSARNEKVLRECIARGIYVVPCTGRIWSGVPEFLRTLPGIQYAITTNGAIVEDVEKHKILDERKLSCAQAIEILELAEKSYRQNIRRLWKKTISIMRCLLSLQERCRMSETD